MTSHITCAATVKVITIRNCVTKPKNDIKTKNRAEEDQMHSEKNGDRSLKVTLKHCTSFKKKHNSKS